MQKVSNLMYFGKIALLLANQNQENVLMHILTKESKLKQLTREANDQTKFDLSKELVLSQKPKLQ